MATSIKVPHAALGIVFFMTTGGPQVLVAQRSPALKARDRWPSKLQLGPAGRVDEPINVSLSRKARQSEKMRPFVDTMDVVSLKVQGLREVIIHRRDNLASATFNMLRKHPSIGDEGAKRIANAAIALSRRVAILPERSLSAIRRESREELHVDIGIGARNVISVVPLAELPPITVDKNHINYLHGSFFLIHVNAQGAQEIIDRQGSEELINPKFIPLEDVEKLPEDSLQPHYAVILQQKGLLRKAISKLVRPTHRVGFFHF